MKWVSGSVLLLAVAWLLNLPLLTIAPLAVLLLLGVNRYLARAWSEGLKARRVCQRTELEIGDTLRVAIQLRNQASVPVVWCLLEDLLPRPSQAAHPLSRPQLTGERLLLLQLAVRQSHTQYYELRFPHRGYYQIGPLLMETGDVFGLQREHRVLVEPTFVTVYPKVIPLSSYALASRRPLGELKLTHRLFEDPTRIAGVREYERGDTLRQIHWPATARTGVLHSKTYEPTCVAGVTVLLDFHVNSYPARGEPYASELAITAAASVCHAVYLMGQQIGLLTNARDAVDRIRTEGWQGQDLLPQNRRELRASTAMAEQSDRLRPVVVETQRGPAQFRRILETLTRCERTDGLTLAELVVEGQADLPRSATVLAVSSLLSAADGLALAELKRQGYAVTVLLLGLDQHQFYTAAGPLVNGGLDVRSCANEVELCAALGSLSRG